MTSRLFMAGVVAVLAASTAGAAALLDIQASPSAPANLDAILADVDAVVAEALQGVARAMPGTPRLGVSIRDLSAAEATAAGLDGIAGAWVTDIRADSVAGKAGLRTGDVIVRVDGQDVRGARHLTRLVEETPPGRVLALEYRRDGQQATASVTLEGTSQAMSLPRDGRAPRPFAFRMPSAPALAPLATRGRLGIGITDLTSQLATYFGVEEGVLVTSVTEGSAAARGGLKAGDVITAVGDSRVTGVGDLTRALAEVEGGSSVEMTVSRERAPMTIAVTPDTSPTRNRLIVRPRGRQAAD